MPRGTAASKVDGNQPAIVAALRARGYCVISLHTIGGGVPDLLVISKADSSRAMLLEVKMPGEKLNAKERVWHDVYPGRVGIVYGPAQAVETMEMFELERWE